MAWSAVCKLLQRRSIDLISQKNGCRLLAVGIFVILVMTFQMGEILLTWSAEKYAAVFSPFSDNIGGRSFQERLCLPVPIDVVYTWVNGSDPALLKELKEFRLQLKHDLNLSMTTDRCNFVHCVPAFGMTVDPPFPQDITHATVSSALLPPSPLFLPLFNRPAVASAATGCRALA